VLSWSPLWNLDALPVDEAQAIARAFNDETAAVSTGGRYRGLAVAPLVDFGAALAELRRAAALGLEGFVLPAWTLCDSVGADAMAPWFAAARDLGRRVFVHPGRLPATREIDNALRRRRLHRHLGLEPQHEVGLAMLTLCQEG
jgi:predicted TIM-barrel fold metal-dependent hydrolase